MHLDNGEQRSSHLNRAHGLTKNELTKSSPKRTLNLTRKIAKPARRFVLTAGLAASAFVTCAFLRHPSMANTANLTNNTMVPVAEDRHLPAASPAAASATLSAPSRMGSTALQTEARTKAETLPAARLKPGAKQPQRDTVPAVKRVAQTRSLFQYHRDDNTPDHLTTVRIDAARQAAAPVSPNLFGNFIEHLGGVVYEALWSQILLNPNLERIETEDTTPAAWQLFGAANWQAGGYQSPRCVRLDPDTKTPSAAIPASRAASLSQSVALSAQRVGRYEVTLVARTAGDGGAVPGMGKIRVALVREQTGRRGRASTPPAGEAPSSPSDTAQAVLTIEQAQWQPFHCTLVVPKSRTRTENRWRFVAQHEGGQAVDIDQIEMFPSDNINGFDPDVLGRARMWDVPLLRYPGGNFASGYHWQDGIGPRATRPTKRNPAWGGVEPNHVGTHEFMTFAKAVHATPQLTVNAGDGTPEEAAAWVRYCNAPPSDKWGRMRAENGALKPFNVRLWEVGNELYGGWQIGHAGAQENADRFVKFRDKMLEADPGLRLIATGKGDEFTPQGMERDEAWNRALLQSAVKGGGRAPDYLSLHPLVPLPDYARGATYDEQYQSAMAHPTYLDNTLIPDVACQIQAIEGPNPRTRIALTEWGIIVGGADWQQSPNHDTLSGAIYNALALNAMLRNSDWVTLANMTALLHGGGIKKWDGIVYVDPQYYTQQMVALARPQSPVATTTTGPGADVPARHNMPAVVDVPDVDAFAARAQTAGRLVVFAVNRHRTDARPLRLQVDNFAARTVKATLLTAPDPRARNSPEAPATVAPRPFPVPAWPQQAGANWQITLPPHSFVVLTLDK